MQTKILCYLFYNPKEALKVDEQVFRDAELRKVFVALRNRVRDGKGTDITLVVEDANSAYGNAEVASILNDHVTDKAYREYLEREEYSVRLSQINELFNTYYARFAEAEEKDKLQVLLELKEALQKTSTSERNYDIHGPEAFGQWMEQYGKPIHYVAQTGLQSVDKTIGGFRGSELCVIVADTGIGKTGLMLNMLSSMVKKGKSVLFFSLEMGVNELIDRLVPIVGGHSAWDIKERAVRKDVLGKTITELQGYNIKIISSGFVTSNDVVSEALTHDPDIIMVDYLQLLNDPKGRDNETERLKQITLNLKRGALNLGKPIITPAQVDKASSKSGSIKIENVASSKEIANSADLGLYLYEKEINDGSVIGSIEYETRLRIVKSRHSQKGLDIRINFDKTTLRMTDETYEVQELTSNF